MDIIKGMAELKEKLSKLTVTPEVTALLAELETSSVKVINSLKTTADESKTRKTEIETLNTAIADLKSKVDKVDKVTPPDDTKPDSLKGVLDAFKVDLLKSVDEKYKQKFDVIDESRFEENKGSLSGLLEKYSGHENFDNIKKSLNIDFDSDSDFGEVVSKMKPEQIELDIKRIELHADAGLFSVAEPVGTDQFGARTLNDDVMAKIKNAKTVEEMDEIMGVTDSMANVMVESV